MTPWRITKGAGVHAPSVLGKPVWVWTGLGDIAVGIMASVAVPLYD